jgi:predicted extracellular nuclease
MLRDPAPVRAGLAALLLLGACRAAPSAPQTVPAADGACPANEAALVPIPAVQGGGDASPLVGRTVTLEGVVTGDFETTGLAQPGFTVQARSGDGDPRTSDALFVAVDGGDRVATGDLVRVTGLVAEVDGETRLTAPRALVVCARGLTVTPGALTLPVASAEVLEAHEGMLVRFAQVLSVTEHFQLGRYGLLTVSNGRLWQPTQRHAPGPEAQALAAANARNRLVVDDASDAQNPDPIVFGSGGQPLSAARPLRAGDQVTDLAGVLVHQRGGQGSAPPAWRLQARATLAGDGPVFTARAARRPTPEPVGGTLRVSAFNVLNYFNTFGRGACALGDGGAATDCRGAADAADFARQADKIVAALVALDAHIVGLMEIENDGYGPASAIADLVARLNAATAPGRYAFVDADARTGARNALGTDGIKVGLLYQPARVTPAGRTAVLSSPAFVTGGDSGPRNRPSLVQAFEQPDGERLVVSVNHLKSKGSGCDAPDAGDGQGACNVVRTNAARTLAQYLATDPTGTGDPDMLLLGDLNAYAMEDPVRAIVSAGFVDLESMRGGADAYSYLFDAQLGSLDHALASASLAAQVTGVTTWHINADEPPVLGYPSTFKSPAQRTALYAPDPFRSSDHDPVLVGLTLARPR